MDAAHDPKTLRVLVLPVGGRPTIKVIEPSLEGMQAVVGGLIECVQLDDWITLVCNEEGKVHGLPANRLLRQVDTGRVVDVLAGDAFVARDDGDGGFVDLTDEDVMRWSAWFAAFLPEGYPVPEPMMEVTEW